MRVRLVGAVVAMVAVVALLALLAAPAVVAWRYGGDPVRPAPIGVPDAGVRPVLDLPTPRPSPQRAHTKATIRALCAAIGIEVRE